MRGASLIVVRPALTTAAQRSINTSPRYLRLLNMSAPPPPHDRNPVPPPVPAYLTTSSSSPLTVDKAIYTAISHAPRVLSQEFTLPIRSGRAWTAPAGSIIRISTPEGAQVGDLNIWNAQNLRERFWASRTRQLHVSVAVITVDCLCTKSVVMADKIGITCLDVRQAVVMSALYAAHGDHHR
jgi:hypothetical protein